MKIIFMLILIIVAPTDAISNENIDDDTLFGTNDFVFQHAPNIDACREKEKKVLTMLEAYRVDKMFELQIDNMRNRFPSLIVDFTEKLRPVEFVKSTIANGIAGYYDLTAWDEINALLKLMKFNPKTGEPYPLSKDVKLPPMTYATNTMWNTRTKRVANDMRIKSMVGTVELFENAFNAVRLSQRCGDTTRFPCSVIMEDPFDSYYFVAEHYRNENINDLLEIAYLGAAMRGNAKAQTEIGMRYYRGDQVEKSLHLAYTFLTMAVNNGVDSINLDSLFSEILNSRDVDHARRMAAILAAWKLPEQCAKPDYQILQAAHRRANYFDYAPEKASGWLIVNQYTRKHDSYVIADNREAKVRIVMLGGMDAKGGLKQFVDTNFDKITVKSDKISEKGFVEFLGKPAFRIFLSRYKKSNKPLNVLIYYIENKGNFYQLQVSSSYPLEKIQHYLHLGSKGLVFY